MPSCPTKFRRSVTAARDRPQGRFPLVSAAPRLISALRETLHAAPEKGREESRPRQAGVPAPRESAQSRDAASTSVRATSPSPYKTLAPLLGLLAVAVAVQAQPPGRGGPPPNWRFVGAEAGRPGAVVKGAPFSADVTTETTMVLQDGNHIHQTSKLRLYRDSEGRTRREQSLNNLGALASNTNLPPVVFINDPVAGVNYALNPTAKTASRSMGVRGLAGGRGPAGGRGGRMRGGPPGAIPERNVKTESLGSKTIEGITAEGTRTTITIPAGQEGNEQPMQTVVETWYSADLQVPVFSRRSDPRTGETVTRYTNINRTEPAHALFDVPSDYKISDAEGRGARSGAK